MRPRTWALWLLLSLSSLLTKAQNNTCGGTVTLNATAELQYLLTPNYETSYMYPSYMECKFIIKAPDKTRVVVNVIDMEMEPRVFDECSDYVRLTEDPMEKNSSKFVTLCETLRNRQYIANANTLTVIFVSDDYYETRGAKLSYQFFNISTCPPDWNELKDGNCVKQQSEQKIDWINAQNRCLEQQSNLIIIDSIEKTSELENLFKSVPTKLWIGYTDAQTEGKLLGLDEKDAVRLPNRDASASLTDNNDDNDCMTLQFGDNSPYRMDGCASYNGYICEMKKDGTTVLYPPPVEVIQEGAYSRSNQYMLWLLLFLIAVLFATILAFLCFMCYKQKDARVHTENATIQQNAFMSDSSQRAEQSRTSASGGPISAISLPSQSNETRPIRTGSSPVSVPIENNRVPKKFPMAPIPNRLPMTEDPSDGDQPVETAIMGQESMDVDTVSAAPKPQPRTLPPMPAREGTFQSINTRDGSTMRTRRNRELFERPIMTVLDNVSAISLDEFWSNKKP